MTQDYPDWTRLFHLVGTSITIPINIEASAVTLDVNLVASAVTLDVTIVASAVTLPVSIDAATVTIDVNLTAAEVTIDINFSDQSVAVFDASKWFTRLAQHIRITGTATINDNSVVEVASYLVLPGTVAYIVGVSYGLRSDDAPKALSAEMLFDSYLELYTSSYRGDAFLLDTPIRHSAGYTISLKVGCWGNGSAIVGIGGFWGYLENV
jgi:hypothetical protein